MISVLLQNHLAETTNLVLFCTLVDMPIICSLSEDGR